MRAPVLAEPATTSLLLRCPETSKDRKLKGQKPQRQARQRAERSATSRALFPPRQDPDLSIGRPQGLAARGQPAKPPRIRGTATMASPMQRLFRIRLLGSHATRSSGKRSRKPVPANRRAEPARFERFRRESLRWTSCSGAAPGQMAVRRGPVRGRNRFRAA